MDRNETIKLLKQENTALRIDLQIKKDLRNINKALQIHNQKIRELEKDKKKLVIQLNNLDDKIIKFKEDNDIQKRIPGN